MQKKPLIYGILNEAACPARIPNCRLVASSVFKAQSGKFVSRDTSAGFFDPAAAADTQIQGWAVVPSSYAGAKYDSDGVYTVHASLIERVEVVNDINARFLIPSDGAPTEAMKGVTCDLSVASSVIKGNIAASSTDVIVIYDFNATLLLLEVGLNPIKMYTLGVV